MHFPKNACKCVRFEICEIACDRSGIFRFRDISSNQLRYLSLLSRRILSKDGISKVIRRRVAERYDKRSFVEIHVD
jgi:hypothetical protein